MDSKADCSPTHCQGTIDSGMTRHDYTTSWFQTNIHIAYEWINRFKSPTKYLLQIVTISTIFYQQSLYFRHSILRSTTLNKLLCNNAPRICVWTKYEQSTMQYITGQWYRYSCIGRHSVKFQHAVKHKDTVTRTIPLYTS